MGGDASRFVFFSSLDSRRALRQRLTNRRVISAVCEPLFSVRALYFTDAERVAPIRAQCPGTIVLYMTSNLLFNLSI